MSQDITDEGKWTILGRVAGYAPAHPWPVDGSLIDMPERKLVRTILRHAHLYQFFDFAVSEALGSHRQGWEYIFVTETRREWLGLESGRQPGDVDVLIYPVRDRKVHLDKVAAIEVKRLALRHGKLGRNVDRYGITQANGLLRDGFPYAGILHIAVVEPGLEEHRRELLRFLAVKDDAMEPMGAHLSDVTGMLAAEKQMGRLVSQGAAGLIGLQTVAIQLGDGAKNPPLSIFPGTGRPCLRNPDMSDNLQRRLFALLCETMPHIEVVRR